MIRRRLRLLCFYLLKLLKNIIFWLCFGSSFAIIFSISYNAPIPLGKDKKLLICPLEQINITTEYPLSKMYVKELTEKFLARLKKTEDDYISLISFPLDEFRNFLLASPLIKDVEVKKYYPFSLNIKAVPTLVVAKMKLSESSSEKKYIYLDKDGNLFFLRENLNYLAEILAQEQFFTDKKREYIGKILYIFKDLGIYEFVEKVSVNDNTVELYLKGYPELKIYFFRFNNKREFSLVELKDNCYKLKSILAQLKLDELEYIDLRFPSACYFKKLSETKVKDITSSFIPNTNLTFNPAT